MVVTSALISFQFKTFNYRNFEDVFQEISNFNKWFYWIWILRKVFLCFIYYIFLFEIKNTWMTSLSFKSIYKILAGETLKSLLKFWKVFYWCTFLWESLSWETFSSIQRLDAWHLAFEFWKSIRLYSWDIKFNQQLLVRSKYSLWQCILFASLLKLFLLMSVCHLQKPV